MAKHNPFPDLSARALTNPAVSVIVNGSSASYHASRPLICEGMKTPDRNGVLKGLRKGELNGLVSAVTPVDHS